MERNDVASDCCIQYSINTSPKSVQFNAKINWDRRHSYSLYIFFFLSKCLLAGKSEFRNEISRDSSLCTLDLVHAEIEPTKEPVKKDICAFQKILFERAARNKICQVSQEKPVILMEEIVDSNINSREDLCDIVVSDESEILKKFFRTWTCRRSN